MTDLEGQSITLMKSNQLFLALLLALFVTASDVLAQTVAATKIINHGPDGGKIVIAIIGDGYTAGEMTKYVSAVNDLVVNGLFAHDFYQESLPAFNVYRVDVASNHSGVGHQPGSPQDTALKTIYTGDWGRCYIEESNNTDKLLNTNLAIVPKYDYVMVLLNESEYGGCRRGSRMYVTSGSGWPVVAHEYGHGIGGLFEEYSVPEHPVYAGFPINTKNCSTLLDQNRVVWRHFFNDINSLLPFPTQLTSAMDSNQTVGMFRGCNTYGDGIYRPVESCRMNTNESPFCPVCLAIMRAAVSEYMGGNIANSSSISRPIAKTNFDGLPFLKAAFSSALISNATPVQETDSFLNMVVRVKSNGSSEIVKVAEIQGNLPERGQPTGNSALEINRGHETIGAEFLPEDPFVIRGFIDPKNPQRGEFFGRTDAATIVVNVPKVTLEDAAAGGITLRLYKVSPGDDELATSSLTNNVSYLNSLKTQQRLTEQIGISANKLKSALRDKFRSLRHRQ